MPLIRTTKITSDADFDAAITRLSALPHDRADDEGPDQKLEATQEIVAAVRRHGDAALAEYTKRFDGADLEPSDFEIESEDLERATRDADAGVIAALERAAENIRRFHTKHLRQSWEERFEDGTVLGQRITPIESVGVYVPGGKAFYPSSVLMNIVPAQVAGVNEIVMVSPPSWNGTIHPVVLAAAKTAGAHRVFRVGGAQSIAALAYGTETIPRVLKITGPGNRYVTFAKRLVRGVCDIDTEAGPSEVVVIADAAANPIYVAGELLAQAEHDEEASSILLTDSAGLSEMVAAAIETELNAMTRAEIIRKSLASRGEILVTRNLDEAVRLVNALAPEHLAVYTREPRETLKTVVNAGAIMLGEATPVAVGDYYAGPNHILPTGRRARFSSPLSAEDFRKVSSIIEYSAGGIRSAGADIMRLANVEELTAHARAIEMRL